MVAWVHVLSVWLLTFLDEAEAIHCQDDVAVLVRRGDLRPRMSERRIVPGTLFDKFDYDRKGVAGVNWLVPANLVHPAAAEGCIVVHVPHHEQAGRERTGQPPARDELTEDGLRRSLLVDVNRLRVVALCKFQHLFFGHLDAPTTIDQGATVVWEWTGDGGDHNVAAEDGSYKSDLTSTAGHTFTATFDTEAVSLYACSPHKAMGMKGAVIVDDIDVGAAPAGPDEFQEPDYGSWFDDVENFSETVDATGQDEVRIAVGAPGNGGGFAFEPAAVHIDPGTTVIWEWTGEGGHHNVYDEETGYESPMQHEAGATYALTFDGTGISKYACAPHETMGMKGAIVIGNPAADEGMSLLELLLWGVVFGTAVSPLAVSEIIVRRRKREADDRRDV